MSVMSRNPVRVLRQLPVRVGNLMRDWKRMVNSRPTLREYFAEFFGAFMIILFGAGVECQVRLHYRENGYKEAFGNYLSCRLAWATGVALGAWVSGGISGAHINPAVTIALTAFRGFSPRKAPAYILSQVLGCASATFVVYAMYAHSIARFEGGDMRTVVGPHSTAGLFITKPLAFIPLLTAYFTEFVATAALIFFVLAFCDFDNWAPPSGTLPVGLFLAVLGIGSSLGSNTGYALNPARDTGPRLALSLLGYGAGVWKHDDAYWFFGPWLSTVAGALFGAFLYDAFLYQGIDSWMNGERVPEEPIHIE